jgi:Zn-finger nucleic acid-binding protein
MKNVAFCLRKFKMKRTMIWSSCLIVTREGICDFVTASTDIDYAPEIHWSKKKVRDGFNFATRLYQEHEDDLIFNTNAPKCCSYCSATIVKPKKQENAENLYCKIIDDGFHLRFQNLGKGWQRWHITPQQMTEYYNKLFKIQTEDISVDSCPKCHLRILSRTERLKILISERESKRKEIKDKRERELQIKLKSIESSEYLKTHPEHHERTLRQIKRQNLASIEKQLYLMKCERNSLYKIGVSVSPQYREKTLCSDDPSVKLVGSWFNLADQERPWHDYFNKERVRGEWFSLTKTQVGFFCSRNTAGQPAPIQQQDITI